MTNNNGSIILHDQLSMYTCSNKPLSVSVDLGWANLHLWAAFNKENCTHLLCNKSYFQTEVKHIHATV